MLASRFGLLGRPLYDGVESLAIESVPTDHMHVGKMASAARVPRMLFGHP